MPDFSIIIPLYNCEKYLPEALDSIRNQTVSNWEAILVDDKSVDKTLIIANKYAQEDERFTVLKQDCNQGAAKARNKALEYSTGRFVAYLDSDDYWFPSKLDKQREFMLANHYGGCFTSYETVNEDGGHRNYIHVESQVDYKRFLKKPPTCSHTIMFDTNIVDKNCLVMPDIRKRQDGATWLNVLKEHRFLYGLDDVLAANRKRSDSLSSNKISAVKSTWYMYSKVQGLNKVYAGYCLFWQIYHAAIKRVGRH